MTRTPLLALLLALLPAIGHAQPAPIVGTTVKATSPNADALCVGCPIATQVPAANSGAKIQTITLPTAAAPSITTEKLYNISGGLYWNGALLATGSSVSGTLNTIGLFTGASSIGNSVITQSGTAVTVTGTLAVTGAVTGASFTGTLAGNGASITAIPTSAVSTGNFVATVASGTGITSSVVTGNAAATTISLNNTAVTPGAYDYVTVDQQGRVTTASTTIGVLLNVSAFGQHLISATGTGTNSLQIANTSTVAGNQATLNVYAGSTTGQIYAFNQNETPSSFIKAGGIALANGGAGGISLVAYGAAGTIDYFTGGTTLRGRMSAAGDVSVGGANLTDAVATPTIASGFGSGPTIAGKASFFTVVAGTGSPTTGTVNFNATFANIPVCVASSDVVFDFTVGPSTTQVAITSGIALNSGNKIFVQCRGY